MAPLSPLPLLAATVFALSSLASAQDAFISEFMAANDSTLADEDGSFPDWIEIHNPASSAADLTGWHLTDNAAQLTKWTFPAVSIPTGGYLIVFASDKNRAVAGSELHTNFKLSAAGEYLALVKPDGITTTTEFAPFPLQQPDVSHGLPQGTLVQEDVVDVGAALRYLVPGGVVTNWNATIFDDSAWPAGTTGIGYDRGFSDDYRPLLSSDIESAAYNENSTVYLRIPFTVDDPASVTDLTFKAKYDDGFVAYLNGNLLAGANEPASPTYNSLATANDEADLENFETWDVSAHISNLVAGNNNVLAIQMLNRSDTSSDFLMLPKLETSSPAASAGSPYVFLAQPTPGTVNNTPIGAPSGDVTLSETSGVKTAAISVTMTTSGASAQIRYTLDGTDPTETSSLYSSTPIPISDPTRLRARAYEPGKPAGGVAVGDYSFLESSVLNYLSDVPVIVMDNFGAGSYPNKGRNQDGSGLHHLPRQSNVMSFFDTAGNSQPFSLAPSLETRTGCRVRGSSGSTFPRKPLSVEFWDDEDNDRHLSPFGMSAESDWALYAPYYTYDKSLLHNPVSFEFAKLMGSLAPDSRVVVVFQNKDGGKIGLGDLAGVYVLMEKIERGRMGMDFDKMDDTGSTGGWALQIGRMPAIPDDLPANTLQPNFHARGANGILEIPDDQVTSTSQSSDDVPHLYTSYLNFLSPDGFSILPAQRAPLQSQVRAMDAAMWSASASDPVTGYPAWIDVDSWARFYAVQNFTTNKDAIKFSTYVYSESPTSKIKMGPVWDLDRAYRQTGSATSDPLWLGDQDWYGALFSHEDFHQAYQDAWQEARATVITDTVLRDLVDQSAAGLRSDQISASGVSYSTWLNELTLMKNWMVDRATYLDSQYEALPTVSPATELFAGSVVVSMTANAGGTVWYTTDGSDPRAPGGGIAASAQSYSTAITLTQKTQLRARTKDGSRWSGIIGRDYYQLSEIPQLVISEIAYNPADPSAAEIGMGYEDAGDFEFLEIHNTGPSTEDLSWLTLAAGVDFDFSTTSLGTLAPGGYAILVKNLAAFEARYGTGLPVAGQYEGKLSNGGEALTLTFGPGVPVLDLTYGSTGGWPGRADGAGSTLELILPSGDPYAPASWRSSSEYNGNPGSAGAGPDNRIVINEVLTHSDLPQTDSIELYNTTGSAIDISGWLLSDTRGDYIRYQIPATTTLPAGGYIVFDESHFNSSGTSADFALSSSSGDDVYLLEASAGEPIRFVDHIEFGASFNGVTLGRWPNGTGEIVPMASDTLGSVNSGALAGSVIINEIMYHPPGDDPALEFVELCNTGTSTVNLANWTLRGGADFDFTAAHSLAPGGVIVLVAFDPATETAKASAFRTAYSIDASIPLTGPFSDGPLGNDEGSLRLQRPDSPPASDPEFYPQVIEDLVSYQATTPWPTAAAGNGASLNRLGPEHFGNFAASWGSEPPTPGGKHLYYASWRDSMFGPGSPAGSAELEDFDADGIKNIVEFALGLNPLVSDTHLLPDLSTDGSVVSLSYTRDFLRSGISYKVEQSDDLAHWTDLADTFVSSQNFSEVRKASVTTSGDPRLFLKITIDQ